jgi:hypothetical protein
MNEIIIFFYEKKIIKVMMNIFNINNFIKILIKEEKNTLFLLMEKNYKSNDESS